MNQNPQIRGLQAGVDILVATPGRLLDLMQQGFVDLAKVEVLILDEADRMLDMGFLPDLRRIVDKVPKQRQTLFFSATMPPEIRKVADAWLEGPGQRQGHAGGQHGRSDRAVGRVRREAAQAGAADPLARETPWTRALVFTRTKHGADKVAKRPGQGRHRADAIHGNKTQRPGSGRWPGSSSPKPLVLVATDIAARGLDIDRISHVVNFDLPNDAEGYIHRIGRTGRAGATGTAISFCDPTSGISCRPSSGSRGRRSRSVKSRLICRRPRPRRPTGIRSAQVRPRGAGQPAAAVGRRAPAGKVAGSHRSGSPVIRRRPGWQTRRPPGPAPDGNSTEPTAQQGRRSEPQRAATGSASGAPASAAGHKPRRRYRTAL